MIQLTIKVETRVFLTPSSSWAVILCSGFFTRQLFTKSLNSSDHLSGYLKNGGGFVGIINIAYKKNNEHYILGFHSTGKVQP